MVDLDKCIEVMTKSSLENKELDVLNEKLMMHGDIYDDYYQILLEGRVVKNGLSVLSTEYLILFKAKAYLDLKRKKEIDGTGDLDDIKKHKKDILRISAELMLEKIDKLPVSVKEDIDTFINNLSQDPFDSNSLKNYGLKNEEVIAVLKRVFW